LVEAALDRGCGLGTEADLLIDGGIAETATDHPSISQLAPVAMAPCGIGGPVEMDGVLGRRGAHLRPNRPNVDIGQQRPRPGIDRHDHGARQGLAQAVLNKDSGAARLDGEDLDVLVDGIAVTPGDGPDRAGGIDLAIGGVEKPALVPA
jgi:hypothetical protein